MKKSLLNFLCFLFFFTLLAKPSFAQRQCSQYLGTSQIQKTIQDIDRFFGQSNTVFIFDSEINLKNTYKYDPQTQSWNKDPYFYKNQHHEFTLIHLENIPPFKTTFKLIRAEVQFPGPHNDFITRLNFNEIINIEKPNPRPEILVQSLSDENILILSYTNKVQPQPDNPNMVMVKTRWVFEKKPDNTLLIFQSDTITQEKDGRVIAGERYDFEIKSSPNNRRSQVESILDLYLNRIDENSYRILYH